ncbi:MAG: iron-containing alcohol dehydrogenase [Thermoguttaceae bacterium]|jgi:NADP-dependent alcohol dehydrogenase
MLNFTYFNPVKIVFGKGTIKELPNLIPAASKVMMVYGGGSIKQNGVYDQVAKAMAGRPMIEFAGIEPNPRYETCMKCVDSIRSEGADFLLAVGGGSSLDAVKFIAVASCYSGDDPWDFMKDPRRVPAEVLPLGCVITLPATGSEANCFAVISRDSTREKLAFSSPQLFPKFSILDPATTFSLPPRQTVNGIVDAFVHVMEQYMTFDAGSPLQDRQAEAILLTLLEEGPKAMANPKSYSARSNIMWCATNALSGLIGCGVPQDWSTHMIGHEITVLYGLDHAQTLALIYPGTIRHFQERKKQKLLQYARRVWGLADGDENALINAAIEKTEDFFRSLGVGTRLADYKIPAEAGKLVAERLAKRGRPLGERGDVKPSDVEAIFALRA